MVVEIATTIAPALAEETIEQIYRVSGQTPELTPRPPKVLRRLLADNNLVTVFVNGALAGWGVREPLARGVVEIGMTYVAPEFRASNAFDRLAHELVRDDVTSLVATYKPELARYLEREFGFRRSTLAEFVRLSRGRFIMNRLRGPSRTAVRTHLRHSSPIYLVKEATR